MRNRAPASLACFASFLTVFLGAIPVQAWVWPTVSHTITSDFGPRHHAGDWGFHYGVDIRAAKGTPVFAAEAGDFTWLGGAFGVAEVDHGSLTSRYRHCKVPAGSASRPVVAGEFIAPSGDAGAPGYPHLHFDFGQPHDGPPGPHPFRYLPYDNEVAPTVSKFINSRWEQEIENGDYINGRVDIKTVVRTNDEWDLNAFQLLVDGGQIGYISYDPRLNCNPATCKPNDPEHGKDADTLVITWDTTKLETGWHTLTGRATDAGGSFCPKAVNVYVGNCVQDLQGWGDVGCNRFAWVQACEDCCWLCRSDHRWGPYVDITGDVEITYEDNINFTCVDRTVEYSRPYWYILNDVYIGSAEPESLLEPAVPSRPMDLVAAEDTTDCGSTVFLSWEASTGADSYYVFRCTGQGLDECVPVPELLGSTTSTSYVDTAAYGDEIFYYSVIAWNASGASEESVADSAWSMQDLQDVSLTASQISVENDSILVCPGGDADSLVIDSKMVDVCGRVMDEPPYDVYAVLTAYEGNVHVCGGDTLRPIDFRDEEGHIRMVAHHIGGCGSVRVCVHADSLVMAQQPVVVFRSPDFNADGVVDSLDEALWTPGGECTDLNWDGTEKDSLDSGIVSAHLLHTSNPTIAINAPNDSEWWNAGDEAEITWQFAPTQMTNAYDTVDLFLSTDGGVSYPELIASVLSNDGSYLWSIPQGLSSGQCKVKAVAQDAHGCFVSDTSNAALTIAAVKSGFVVADTTWNSPVSVIGDVTVVQGVRLCLSPGTNVRFDTVDSLHGGTDTGKCELVVAGGLTADGSRTLPIEFSSLSSSPQASDWRGIRLRPGSTSNVIDNCVIRYAYTGIEAESTTITVDSCTISDFSNDGIKAIASAVTLTRDSLLVGSTGVRGIELTSATSGTVEHNTITGFGSGVRYGIELKDNTEPDVTYNWIEGLKYGIKCTDGSPVFWHNRIQGSTGGGIQCYGGAMPSVRYNTIEGFQGTGVLATDYAVPFLGDIPDSGSNRIYASQSSFCYVMNLTEEYTVYAEYNWWGTSSPSAKRFFGDVDYSPCDASDPGTSYALPLVAVVSSVPGAPYVMQSYPNPLNPRATIEYGVSKPGSHVRIVIYDISGRVLKALVDEPQRTGRYSVTWDGRDGRGNPVASGVYFYEVTIGDFRQAKKLVVLK